jgi:hypothetical protein
MSNEPIAEVFDGVEVKIAGLWGYSPAACSLRGEPAGYTCRLDVAERIESASCYQSSESAAGCLDILFRIAFGATIVLIVLDVFSQWSLPVLFKGILQTSSPSLHLLNNVIELCLCCHLVSRQGGAPKDSSCVFVFAIPFATFFANGSGAWGSFRNSLSVSVNITRNPELEEAWHRSISPSSSRDFGVAYR